MPVSPSSPDAGKAEAPAARRLRGSLAGFGGEQWSGSTLPWLLHRLGVFAPPDPPHLGPRVHGVPAHVLGLSASSRISHVNTLVRENIAGKRIPSSILPARLKLQTWTRGTCRGRGRLGGEGQERVAAPGALRRKARRPPLSLGVRAPPNLADQVSKTRQAPAPGQGEAQTHNSGLSVSAARAPGSKWKPLNCPPPPAPNAVPGGQHTHTHLFFFSPLAGERRGRRKKEKKRKKKKRAGRGRSGREAGSNRPYKMKLKMTSAAPFNLSVSRSPAASHLHPLLNPAARVPVAGQTRESRGQARPRSPPPSRACAPARANSPVRGDAAGPGHP